MEYEMKEREAEEMYISASAAPILFFPAFSRGNLSLYALKYYSNETIFLIEMTVCSGRLTGDGLFYKHVTSPVRRQRAIITKLMR